MLNLSEKNILCKAESFLFLLQELDMWISFYSSFVRIFLWLLKYMLIGSKHI